jgi:hypothetical protein
LDRIVYKYGNNAEVTVGVNQSNPKKIEVEIPVSEGQATILVEAIDAAQNVATVSQEVKGAIKPKIEVVPDDNDPSYLIIRASDNDGLRMVSFYINEQEYKTDPNISLNQKTFEYRIQVSPGTTNVTVHAYNISEQVTEFIGIYNY